MIDIKNIRPRGKMILVRKDDAPSRVSVSGIVAPDSMQMEDNSIGTVVAVGPEIKDVKKGDRVIYGMYAGERLEHDEGAKKIEYRLLLEEFVIAFIKSKN